MIRNTKACQQRIKRLGLSKLEVASFVQMGENAEKALRLNAVWNVPF
jgi:hypothetical protein